MTISSGGYVVTVVTADGETVALGCDEVSGLTDDLVTPFLTADGYQVPLRVDGATLENQWGFPVITADDEAGLASANRTVVYNPPRFNLADTKPYTDGNFTSSSSGGVHTITPTGTGLVTDNDVIARVLYYSGVDSSGLTNKINTNSKNYVLDANMFDLNYGLSNATAGWPSINISVRRLDSAINISTATFSDIGTALGSASFGAYKPYSRVYNSSIVLSGVTTGVEQDGCRYVSSAYVSGDIYGIVYELSIPINGITSSPLDTCIVNSGSTFEFSGNARLIGYT